MQFTFKLARPVGFAVLAVATATSLSLGACSKSHDDKSSDASPATSSSSPVSAKGHQDSVQGLIASVSGSSVQVTHQSETATVEVAPSAKIIEYSNAQLPDFATGNCVRVNFTPAPNPGPGTAVAVQQNPPAGDKCPQPKTIPSGSPGALLPAGPAQALVGTITSITGNTIDVASTDANGNPSQTALTVNDQTHYTKGVTGNPQVIAQGKCIVAHGTKEGSAPLQATLVVLNAANNGKCA